LGLNIAAYKITNIIVNPHDANVFRIMELKNTNVNASTEKYQNKWKKKNTAEP
jgi:hypothetical protein